MKIIKLSAENFKKLRAVEITPTGELVEITGRNGAGKSSVLDAIWAALGGAAHIQAVPIRKGQTKARIRLDLGELIVERRFAANGGSTLLVENAQGARYASPQGILDALLGALTFDPLAFVTQKPHEQFEALRAIVKLDVDIDQLDGLNRRDFDRRTEITRDARALRAQADGITVPAGLPEAAIDAAGLKDQMAAAAKINAEIETRRGRREQAARDITDQRNAATGARTRAHDLLAEAERLETTAQDFDQQAAILQAKLDAAPPLPEPVDAEALRIDLDAAEAMNRGIAQRARKAQLVADADRLIAQSSELTATMEARAKAKTDAIMAAAMPVPGLGFGDGLVTFEEMPFEQASSAEQLRVSVAIAMAANPKLRVIRIKEGSLLDPDNLALIAAMAKERDYQVWLETCHGSGGPAVVIEDGAVKEVRKGEVKK